MKLKILKNFMEMKRNIFPQGILINNYCLSRRLITEDTVMQSILDKGEILIVS